MAADLLRSRTGRIARRSCAPVLLSRGLRVWSSGSFREFREFREFWEFRVQVSVCSEFRA